MSAFIAPSPKAGTLIEKRVIRAPRGPEKTCRGWIQEAALRMLMNNLDPEVAEDPDRLIVYGGSGKAARTWKDFDSIVATLKKLCTPQGKLHSRKRSGNCAPFQRAVSTAIKRARFMALLAYVADQ